MPIKKSDLYSSLWKSCDELRGGMDAGEVRVRHLPPRTDAEGVQVITVIM